MRQLEALYLVHPDDDSGRILDFLWSAFGDGTVWSSCYREEDCYGGECQMERYDSADYLDYIESSEEDIILEKIDMHEHGMLMDI